MTDYSREDINSALAAIAAGNATQSDRDMLDGWYEAMWQRTSAALHNAQHDHAYAKFKKLLHKENDNG